MMLLSTRILSPTDSEFKCTATPNSCWLGAALLERIRFDRGGIRNASLTAYRVPRVSDVPTIEIVPSIVRTSHRPAPGDADRRCHAAIAAGPPADVANQHPGLPALCA
jgi:hypothetical protein